MISSVSNDKLVQEMGRVIAEQGTKEALKHTIAASLMTAAAVPIAVGNAVRGIDDDWALACKRSDRVGVLLARGWCENGAADGQWGEGKEGDAKRGDDGTREEIDASSCGRCVNLIGFSFGARVVYACLKELLRLQELWDEERFSPSNKVNIVDCDDGTSFICAREPKSVVGNVVVMGMPAHVKRDKWASIRERVVAGRIVNCWSSRDDVVKLLFQYRRKLGSIGAKGEVVGCQPVGVEGVEDIDTSEVVLQHEDWGTKVRDVFALIGELG